MEIKIISVIYMLVFLVDEVKVLSPGKLYETFENFRRMKREEINYDLDTRSTSFTSSSSTSSSSSKSLSSTSSSSSSSSPSSSSTSSSSSSSPSSTYTETSEAPARTSLYPSSSSSTTWSTSSTASNIEKYCLAKRNIEDFCEVPAALASLDIWNIYSEMFSDEVLQTLLLNCASGHWCLEDRFAVYAGLIMLRAEMVKKSRVFSAACEPGVRACLDKIVSNLTHCITYRRLNFTLQSIDLLCSLTRSDEVNIDEACLGHVLVALHVTVVDILRDQNQKAKQDIEHGITDDTCKTPEAQMTRTYLCIETKCPAAKDRISRFWPWQWFVKDVGLISKDCHFIRGVCDDDTNFDDDNHMRTTFSSSTSTSATIPAAELAKIFGENKETNKVTDYDKFKKEEETTWNKSDENINMLIGLFVASVIVLGFMVGVVSVWWKKHRRFRMEKDGYSPLISDERGLYGRDPLIQD